MTTPDRISYTAACPGCGRDCEWTVSHVSNSIAGQYDKIGSIEFDHRCGSGA